MARWEKPIRPKELLDSDLESIARRAIRGGMLAREEEIIAGLKRGEVMAEEADCLLEEAGDYREYFAVSDRDVTLEVAEVFERAGCVAPPIEIPEDSDGRCQYEWSHGVPIVLGDPGWGPVRPVSKPAVSKPPEVHRVPAPVRPLARPRFHPKTRGPWDSGRPLPSAQSPASQSAELRKLAVGVLKTMALMSAVLGLAGVVALLVESYLYR